MSNATSLSWRPVSSSDVIWNGPFDRAEVRDHDLVGLDRAGKERRTQQLVGRLVLEDAGTGHARAAHAGAFQQLAPLAGRFPGG